MDADIATCTYRVLWENFCHIAAAFLDFIGFDCVTTLLLVFHFHFSFINSFGRKNEHGKGKVKLRQRSGVRMKYEMIFKQFNIIPPISEMLTQSPHISHFSQNLSSFV